MQDEFIKGAKYLWNVSQFDPKAVARIAASYNVSFPLAHTLLTRGFSKKEDIDAFLFSSFERDVFDPSALKDASKAVDRLLLAIEKGEKILIFGDYDVDGITSSALMMTSLLPLGAQVNFFLPHRVRDGYGLSTRIVERAARNGYTLIITVDCGITAFEQAIRAKQLGIDLIITDHHRQHDTVPDAYAIINPNQNDCTYPFKVFAGVGVAFKILSLLYARKNLQMPSKSYELLLLGTVADVVPLLGENRFWVRHGLNHVNKTNSLSFSVLKQNGLLKNDIVSSTDIAFSITPQINALGRLEDPRQGVKFLIGADEAEVREVGRILLELNEARKLIERSILQEIMREIEQKRIDLSVENVIIATSTQWPPGVIGLVASRLVSAFGRPAILFHETKDGVLKGSCRSINGFNMFDALNAHRDLLIQFGGHSQAAGLAMQKANLPALKDALEKLVSEQLTPLDLEQKITIDAPAQLSDLGRKFMDDLQHLEPFGHQNPIPCFYIQNVTCVEKPRLLKDQHVKCTVFSDGVIKPLMFFNRPELDRKSVV